MEKKYYKGIDITYLDEEERGYIYELSDEELATDKEFLEVKNKARSLSKKAQNINCFMEGYFSVKKKFALEEGVKVWKNIFKHEKQKFVYDEAMEYAKMGREYYYFVNGSNSPSLSK